MNRNGEQVYSKDDTVIGEIGPLLRPPLPLDERAEKKWRSLAQTWYTCERALPQVLGFALRIREGQVGSSQDHDHKRLRDKVDNMLFNICRRALAARVEGWEILADFARESQQVVKALTESFVLGFTLPLILLSASSEDMTPLPVPPCVLKAHNPLGWTEDQLIFYRDRAAARMRRKSTCIYAPQAKMERVAKDSAAFLFLLDTLSFKFFQHKETDFNLINTLVNNWEKDVWSTFVAPPNFDYKKCLKALNAWQDYERTKMTRFYYIITKICIACCEFETVRERADVSRDWLKTAFEAYTRNGNTIRRLDRQYSLCERAAKQIWPFCVILHLKRQFPSHEPDVELNAIGDKVVPIFVNLLRRACELRRQHLEVLGKAEVNATYHEIERLMGFDFLLTEQRSTHNILRKSLADLNKHTHGYNLEQVAKSFVAPMLNQMITDWKNLTRWETPLADWKGLSYWERTHLNHFEDVAGFKDGVDNWDMHYFQNESAKKLAPLWDQGKNVSALLWDAQDKVGEEILKNSANDYRAAAKQTKTHIQPTSHTPGATGSDTGPAERTSQPRWAGVVAKNQPASPNNQPASPNNQPASHTQRRGWKIFARRSGK